MENLPEAVFPKVTEVYLPNAPLIVVLAQVRFESILSIQNQANLAPFQDAIRSQYPILRGDRSNTTAIDPTKGAVTVTRQIVWRFSDIDEKWELFKLLNIIKQIIIPIVVKS